MVRAPADTRGVASAAASTSVSMQQQTTYIRLCCLGIQLQRCGFRCCMRCAPDTCTRGPCPCISRLPRSPVHEKRDCRIMIQALASGDQSVAPQKSAFLLNADLIDQTTAQFTNPAAKRHQSHTHLLHLAFSYKVRQTNVPLLRSVMISLSPIQFNRCSNLQCCCVVS